MNPSPFSRLVRVRHTGRFPLSLSPANRTTGPILIIAPHSREFVKIPPESAPWETRVQIARDSSDPDVHRRARRSAMTMSLLSELKRLLLRTNVSRIQLQFSSHRPDVIRALYSTLARTPNLTVAYGRRIVTDPSPFATKDVLPPKKRLRLATERPGGGQPPSRRREVPVIHQIYVSANVSTSLLEAGRLCFSIAATSPESAIVNIAVLSRSDDLETVWTRSKINE